MTINKSSEILIKEFMECVVSGGFQSVAPDNMIHLNTFPSNKKEEEEDEED